MSESRDASVLKWWQMRNLPCPPITDPYYADSLALRSHMESYDYIVSQPSVLNEEQGARLLEIMRQPRKPLPGAIPLEDETSG